MKILGIDPGTIKCGWALLEYEAGQIVGHKSGVVEPTPKSKPINARLVDVFKEIDAGIKRFKPDVVAYEEGFIGDNPKTGMAIGMARAMAILAAGLNDVACHGFTPQEVKRAATGDGRADKETVQRYIMMILSLPQELDSDQSDAIAIAMAWAHYNDESNLLMLASKGD